MKDVTDHPWAGADVVMTLTARDEGGNEGKSEPFAFRGLALVSWRGEDLGLGYLI